MSHNCCAVMIGSFGDSGESVFVSDERQLINLPVLGSALYLKDALTFSTQPQSR